MTQQPRSSDSFPMWPVLALLGMFGVLLVIVLAGNVTRTAPVATPVTPTEVAQLPTATTQPVEVASASYDPAAVAEGRTIFLGICAGCHGPDAHGITGLGKDLVTSEFVHGLSDDELLTFIQTGRQIFDPLNTTGVEMPPRGGNPGLTDNDLRNVIAYVRTLGSAPAGQVAALAAPTAVPNAGPAEPTKEFVIVGANVGAIPELPPPAARTGGQVYAWNCAGCHGANGEGVPYNGSALTAGALPADSAALAALLADPQISAPSAGFVHPYNGGYPAITDEELTNLMDYIQTLAG